MSFFLKSNFKTWLTDEIKNQKLYFIFLISWHNNQYIVMNATMMTMSTKL